MRSITVVAGLLLVACQQYVEVTPAPIPASGQVRLTLGDDATPLQLDPVGSGVKRIEGKVVGATDSTIGLAVSWLTRRSGYEESWQGETVWIPRRSVIGLEKKKLSVPRTLFTLGAMVAGSFAARGMINGGDATASGSHKSGGGK